ncbi:ClpXP protease specificity-enhancing factor SspB [Nisaea acidiphila]|uniref:ClpXP protease specificity-enhancing factor SspB n=1 Tax=Nisaea acidiphila TaxID=1862145 RepID=A0A9J7AYW5_9PROT|nr:ClpXP protease specificity-enhancing factor SspB [Nisaea acidiphila]
MLEEPFQYDMMVDEALRGVVRRALRQVAQHGLPGNHHFYITFKTRGDGVSIPPYLLEKYVDEMTIVLQFQFWDLEIEEEFFSVSLSFNDVRERLVIPFAAITGFADPSVKFGLQFQTLDESEVEDLDLPEMADDEAAEEMPEDESDSQAMGQVVSLDNFRKKK